MTILRLGDYARLMRARKPSNVVPLRKVQQAAQEVRRWQIDSPEWA